MQQNEIPFKSSVYVKGGIAMKKLFALRCAKCLPHFIEISLCHLKT